MNCFSIFSGAAIMPLVLCIANVFLCLGVCEKLPKSHTRHRLDWWDRDSEEMSPPSFWAPSVEVWDLSDPVVSGIDIVLGNV